MENISENISEYEIDYEEKNNNMFLGGNEIVVGGWGEYEINKRALRSKLNNEDHGQYYSKKYIYPQDVIDSIMKENVHKTSQHIINRFVSFLKSHESKNSNFNNVWILPSLTSTKIDDFSKEYLYDNDEMQKMNLFLQNYANMMNLNVTLHNLLQVPSIYERPIHITNSNGIMNLESKMIPNINIIEKNLAIIASNCDKIKRALRHRKRYNREIDSDSGSESDSESDSDSDSNEKCGDCENHEDGYDNVDPNCYRDEDIDDSVEINAIIGNYEKEELIELQENNLSTFIIDK